MQLDVDDQTVFFGDEGSAEFIGEQLLQLGCRRILCVTGRESYGESGAQNMLDRGLKDQTVFRFSDFSTNPQFPDLMNGLACFRSFKPDGVIGVGGGSVLDMAKLINFFGSSQIDPNEWLDHAADASMATLLPLMAIPTTAGTGSEATAFAVLYRSKKKYSVAHSGMLPDMAILIPALTDTMTPYQTACSGFDAFSQAIESYWAVGSTEESRNYSARAITLCLDHLEKAVLTPSPEDRVGMLKAAYWAGRAINIAKTTAAHALSYTLTSFYGLPHGHAVAMLLPVIFEWNADVQDEEVNDVRGAVFVRAGVNELCSMLAVDSPEAAVQFLRGMCGRIGLDGTWIGNADVETLQARLVDQVNMERMGNNPRRLTRTDLQQIVSQI